MSIWPCVGLSLRLLIWVGSRALDSLEDFIQFPGWISKPVCRPDPVDLPIESFQYRLSQTISVACRVGVVVCSANTLNTEDVATRSFTIDNGKVEKETGASHLGMHAITSSRERVQQL